MIHPRAGAGFSSPVKYLFLLFGIFSFGKSVCQPVSPWADSCTASSFAATIVLPVTGFSHFNRTMEYPGGDIIAVGSIRLTNTPDTRVNGLVMRVSKAGAVVWAKNIGFNFNATPGTNDLRITCATICANGDIIVIGQSTLADWYGVHIVRLDRFGNLIWKKLHKVTSDHLFEQVIPTSDTGILLGGVGSSAMTLMKFDAAGTLQWTGGYMYESYSNCRSIVETPGGFYATGYSYNGSFDNTQNLLVKLDKASGNVIWAKKFDRKNAAQNLTEYAYDKMVLKNGKLHLVGSTSVNYTGPDADAQALAIIDTSGVFQNAYRISNPAAPTYKASLSRGKTFDFEKRIGVQFNGTDTSDLHIYRLNNDYSGTMWSLQHRMVGVQEVADMFVYADSSTVAAGRTQILTPSYRERALLVKTTAVGQINNCPGIAASFQVTEFTSVVEPISPPQKLTPSILIAPDTTAATVFNTTGYQWSLSCLSASTCRLGKIAGSNTICTGTPSTYSVLTGGCVNPIVFSGDASLHITQLSAFSVQVNATAAGVFKLFVQMQTTCGLLRDSIEITVLQPAGSVNLGMDRYLCQLPVKLNAGKDYSFYQWSDGSADSILMVTTPGKYWVKVIDNCNNTSTDTVIIVSAGNISYSIGADRELCKGDTIQLSAPAGFTNYTWGPAYNMQVTGSRFISAFPLIDTVYYSSAETNQGCTVYDTIRITIRQPSFISVGNDTSICRDDSLYIAATPGFVSYQWSTGETGRTIRVKNAGTYSVVAVDVYGCRSADTLNMQLFALPVPTISPFANICEGGSRTLSVSPAFISYRWHDGSALPGFIAYDTGWYRVSVTDSRGCRGNDSMHIMSRITNPGNFLRPVDKQVCNFDPVTLSAVSSYSKYLWSTGATTPSISVTTVGDYWLSVTDNNFCTGKDTVTVIEGECKEVILFPGAFTPNKDQRNDVFIPYVRGTLIHYELSVFTRFGDKIFTTRDFTKGWDGTIKGTPMGSGTIVFQCTYQFNNQERKLLKGTVVLIR